MNKSLVFGDFGEDYDSANIVVIPVPYDGTSTYIKGADKGPKALLEASPNLEFYDIETGSEVYKKGIYTDEEVTEKSSPEKMVEAVEKRVSDHLQKGKFIVLIGGEHSVSIGAIKAHAEEYPGLSVLQLDAHSDLRNEYHNSKYNHACVMARVKDLCPFVQVGIRSMDISEKDNMRIENVFFAHDIHDSVEWIDKAIDKLGNDVYVTIDLDVFDPGIMPSTGTPEPGGLDWYKVTGLLKKLAEKRNVVGFDIVELCPSENKAPDFMAAKLLYKLLSYIFMNKEGKKWEEY